MNPFNPSVFWHEAPKMQAHEQLMATVKKIDQDQSYIHDLNLEHAKMYSGFAPVGMDWANKQSLRERRKHTDATKNIGRSVCDTAAALIAKNRPKATIMTEGGDWELHQRAAGLDKLIFGAFTQAKVWTVAQRVFHDATIFGTGVWKLIPSKGAVKVERVLVDEVVVDELECISDAEPRNFYQRKLMDVEAIKAKFPALKAKLAMIQKSNAWDWAPGMQASARQLVVVEAYHLGYGDEPGRRVVAVDGLTLVDEDWNHDWFPYVVVRWSYLTGFYGQGLIEQLAGRQKQIDRIYRFIEAAQHLLSTPHVYVKPGNLPEAQIVNEIGSVVQTPEPPTFFTPQAVHPEVYAWLKELETGGYEEAGISQASAQNRLPVGIESAPAQREYSFKEGQRFALVSQRYEEAFMETAHKMIALFKEMQASGTTVAVKWYDRRLVERIEWEKVHLETDQMLIRIEASSLDALTPAGRLQTAIELSQTGWIDAREGRRLAGHPDLERADRIDNAALEDADATAYRLLKGEVVAVDEASDFKVTRKIVTAERLLAKNAGAPSSIIDHLDAYLAMLDQKEDEMAKAAMAQQMQQQVAMAQASAPPTPGISTAAAQGLNVPFSQGGKSDEGI
jgi:hypothetical protein